jgi:hypothetical protein
MGDNQRGGRMSKKDLSSEDKDTLLSLIESSSLPHESKEDLRRKVKDLMPIRINTGYMVADIRIWSVEDPVLKDWLQIQNSISKETIARANVSVREMAGTMALAMADAIYEYKEREGIKCQSN